MRFPLFGAVFILLASFTARADTIQVFNLNATLSSGTATGTATLDVTTGVFTSVNISVSGGTTIDSFAGAPILTQSDGNAQRNHFADTGGLGLSFFLTLPGTTLIGYTGSPLCSPTVRCLDPNGAAITGGVGREPATTVDAVVSGSLTAQTPEPSSLVTFGTGLLGLAAVVRRSIAKPACLAAP